MDHTTKKRSVCVKTGTPDLIVGQVILSEGISSAITFFNSVTDLVSIYTESDQRSSMYETL